MPVSHERSAWSDERLDDLAGYTRDGFARMDQRFVQIDQRFTQIDQRFARIDERFDRLEDRIAALQRTLVIGMFGLTGTLMATMLAIVLRLG
jgi:hypothetical protein